MCPPGLLDAAAGRDLGTIEPTGVVEGDEAYIELPAHLVDLHRTVAARMRQ